MPAGYTRQSAANIQAGLGIKAADHNAEYNQLASAFDNATGHDHSGSVSGTGSKIILTSSVTGTLPAANGGTGATSATGSAGSVVLSSGPTINSAVLATAVSLTSAITARHGVIGDQNYFWNNLSGIVHKIEDRVLIGAAACVQGGNFPESPMDWTYDTPYNLSFSQNSQLVSINTIGFSAFFGAARTSDFHANNAAAMGGAFFAANDETVHTGCGCWAIYGEAHRNAGAVTGALAMELDVGNGASVVDVNPYSTQSTITAGAWIAAGGAVTSSANSSLGVGILGNSRAFRCGLMFMNSGLDSAVGTGGNGLAIQFCQGQSFRWLNNSSQVQAEIYASNSGVKVLNIVADNTTINGILHQTGAYAYIGHFDSATYPSVSNGLGLNYNFSALQGEISFWNTFTTTTNVSFWFRQQTGASSRTDTLAICADGGVFTGTSGANATNATGPFFYLNSCAGIPTGVPAHAAAGLIAVVYDTTNHKLMAYDQPAGAWKGVTLT